MSGIASSAAANADMGSIEKHSTITKINPMVLLDICRINLSFLYVGFERTKKEPAFYRKLFKQCGGMILI